MSHTHTLTYTHTDTHTFELLDLECMWWDSIQFLVKTVPITYRGSNFWGYRTLLDHEDVGPSLQGGDRGWTKSTPTTCVLFVYLLKVCAQFTFCCVFVCHRRTSTSSSSYSRTATSSSSPTIAWTTTSSSSPDSVTVPGLGFLFTPFNHSAR